MENTRDSAGVFSITSSHSQEPFFLFPPAPSLARLLLCINKFGLQTHSACFFMPPSKRPLRAREGTSGLDEEILSKLWGALGEKCKEFLF